MSFRYDFSDELEEALSNLHKRDKALYESLMKKIVQIASSDEFTINHYKNLTHGLSDYKRVHVGKSFVLMVKVFSKEKFILFAKFKHHDNAYK